MIKKLSILLLFCYGFVLSGSMLSVGHSFLHATSSMTGIHQHHDSVEGHSHRHHINDHGNFFKDLLSFSNTDKKLMTDLSFIMFYYEPAYQLQEMHGSPFILNYTVFKSSEISHHSVPHTPPPDQLHFL